MDTLPHQIGPNRPDTALSPPFASTPQLTSGPTHPLLPTLTFLPCATTSNEIPRTANAASEVLRTQTHTSTNVNPPFDRRRLLLLIVFFFVSLTRVTSILHHQTCLSIPATHIHHTTRPQHLPIIPWRHIKKKQVSTTHISKIRSNIQDSIPTFSISNRIENSRLPRQRARLDYISSQSKNHADVNILLDLHERNQVKPGFTNPLLSLLLAPFACYDTRSLTHAIDYFQQQRSHIKLEIRKAAPLSVHNTKTTPLPVISTQTYTSLIFPHYDQPFRTIKVSPQCRRLPLPTGFHDDFLHFQRNENANIFNVLPECTQIYEQRMQCFFQHRAPPYSDKTKAMPFDTLTIFIVQQVSSRSRLPSSLPTLTPRRGPTFSSRL